MKNIKLFIFGLTVMLLSQRCGKEAQKDYPIRPVPFTSVRIEAGFWKNRMETARKVTIPFALRKSEATGRIANFEVAGGLKEGVFQGKYYNDSDVFKIVEGAAYSLSVQYDPDLDTYLDELIGKIAAAQEDDGYLYSIRTINPDHPQLQDGGRWGNLKDKHELYNAGHMYEAAVAHYQGTGKRTFLDVAIKNADLIASVFGPGKNSGVPGHQEIEIGLARLYRVTGDEKYLQLAKFFIDQRGQSGGHELFGEYAQDHRPVLLQTEAVGHAVRAGYLYSGIADVAALTDDQDYINTIDTIWDNIVSKKMYLTGGVGSHHRGEKFGDNYELPNATAYNETCAAIANMMLNYRLFLLHGDAKYMDVFERILFNGFLSGVSLEGDRFFYPNPLSSDGIYEFNHGHLIRSPWFSTSCCPANVSRFVPSVAGYVYAQRADSLFVNLFMNSVSLILLDDELMTITQQSNYPWDGNIRLTLSGKSDISAALLIRIPGWARNQPVPGDLYRYIEESADEVTCRINDAIQNYEIQRGYAVMQRRWQPGDIIDLQLPMPVNHVVSHDNVNENHGRIAIERGPLVYCAEGIDNDGRALSLAFKSDSPFGAEHANDLLGGVTVLRSSGAMLVPYYAWAHRGAGEMQVWFKNE